MQRCGGPVPDAAPTRVGTFCGERLGDTPSTLSRVAPLHPAFSSLRLYNSRGTWYLIVDDGENITLAQDQQIVAIQLELGTRILGENNAVAFLQLHLGALAVVE